MSELTIDKENKGEWRQGTIDKHGNIMFTNSAEESEKHSLISNSDLEVLITDLLTDENIEEQKEIKGDGLFYVFIDKKMPKEKPPILVITQTISGDEELVEVFGNENDGEVSQNYTNILMDFLKEKKLSTELVELKQKATTLMSEIFKIKKGGTFNKDEMENILRIFYPQYGRDEPFRRNLRTNIGWVKERFTTKYKDDFVRSIAKAFGCKESQVYIGDYDFSENIDSPSKPVIILGNAILGPNTDKDDLNKLKFVGGGFDISKSQIKDITGFEIRGPLIIDESGKEFDFNRLGEYCQEIYNRDNEKRKTFSEEEISELLSFLIDVGNNDKIKFLLDMNYPVEYLELGQKDSLVEKRKNTSGSVYSRMNALRYELSTFLDVDSEEILIPQSEPFNNLSVLAVLGKMKKDHEKNIKVIFGRVNFKELNSIRIPISEVECIIGDLDMQGYKGEINPNLRVSGNIIMDEETQVTCSGKPSLGKLFVGGEVIGLGNILKPENGLDELSEVVHIGRLSEDEPESIQKRIKIINEKYLNSNLGTNIIDYLRQTPNNSRISANEFKIPNVPAIDYKTAKRVLNSALPERESVTMVGPT